MFKELLQRISRELEDAGIPYMVIGGQAVLVHGEPRLTRDVDVTLGLRPNESRRLLDILPRLRLKSLVKDPEDFLKETFVLPTGAPSSPLRVDFIFTWTEYERKALARSRPIRIGRRSVRFISPEDLVVFKILAGRPRDLEDVKGILLRNPRLERRSIEARLAPFDRELEGRYGAVFSDIVRIVKEEGRTSRSKGEKTGGDRPKARRSSRKRR